MKNELWYFLIEAQADKEKGIYGSFIAYGEHLGAALANAFDAAKQENYFKPKVMEAYNYESFEDIEDSNELIKLSDKVYMRETVHSFPLDNPDKLFYAPIGIVKSTIEGEDEYDLIKESFVAYDKNDEGIYVLEVAVSKERIEEVLISTITKLPTVDGFWIYVQSHWDNENTELWVAKHFVSKKMVLEFFSSEHQNTIENGFLKIVVHSITGETNLTFDDHKKIQLHTKDEQVFQDIIGEIIELGYEQTEDFYHLEYGYYHYHYRPTNSLSRENFVAMLKENEFELVDKWNE